VSCWLLHHFRVALINLILFATLRTICRQMADRAVPSVSPVTNSNSNNAGQGKLCSFPGCKNEISSGSYCKKCYKRQDRLRNDLRKHGITLSSTAMKKSNSNAAGSQNGKQSANQVIASQLIAAINNKSTKIDLPTTSLQEPLEFIPPPRIDFYNQLSAVTHQALEHHQLQQSPPHQSEQHS